MVEFFIILLFVALIFALVSGFPVAFAIGGSAFLVAFIASLFGFFDMVMMGALPGRVYSVMTNETLVAIPLFVFMGAILERSKIAANLLTTMSQLFGTLPGGLGVGVIIVGALLAASTGVVGATVVAMGLISLPVMQKAGYNNSLASGLICASGSTAQIIPPSTVLILLGVMIQDANTQAMLSQGIFTGARFGVTDLFAAALIPGLILVLLYLLLMGFWAVFKPNDCPPVLMNAEERKSLLRRVIFTMIPPILLIILVLGSILSGIATATESAALGGVGACVLALLDRQLSFTVLKESARSALMISVMIFAILIGALVMSLVFRQLGGEDVILGFMQNIPGGLFGATLVVLFVMFILGFMLDTFEIIFIIVPVFVPPLIVLGVDPLWFGVVAAIVLQTSYLTPPFGYAIFYLQGAVSGLNLSEVYKGVIPFVTLQIICVALIWIWPELALWLPSKLN